MAETERDLSARLLAGFESAGAVRVEPGYLQPADVLLDLYGENIRARAYRTDDPVDGEQMLRPDFTVPVVQMHMEERREPARYTYAGPVWRRQVYGSVRAREYWQVGYEVFDGAAPAAADAEVFSKIAGALGDCEVVPITGDLSFLLAGIEALDTTEARKVALRRHLWRPKRFARLLARFAGEAPFDSDTRDLPEAALEPVHGLRGADEIAARLQTLRDERETPPLTGAEVGLIQSLLSVRGMADASLAGLRAIARSFPALAAPCDRMEARLDALAGLGHDPSAIPFDAQFGRSSMEYYDGFVFAFRSADVSGDLATGGRYDALTRVLGKGHEVPAVGGVVRPAMLLAAMEAAG